MPPDLAIFVDITVRRFFKVREGKEGEMVPSRLDWILGRRQRLKAILPFVAESVYVHDLNIPEIKVASSFFDTIITLSGDNQSGRCNMNEILACFEVVFVMLMAIRGLFVACLWLA